MGRAVAKPGSTRWPVLTRRARLGRFQESAAFALVAALALILVALPLGHVVASITPTALTQLGSPRIWSLFARTVALAAAVTSTSLAIGIPLGAMFARTRMRARGLFLAAHVLPLFLPPLVLALGWSRIVGGGRFAQSVYFGPAGLVLVLTCAFSPVVTLLTMFGILGLDPSIEEAALLTAPPRFVVARLLIPAVRSSISVAAIIVFALTLGEVGAAMFLRVDVYGAAVFARLGSFDFAPGEAATLCLPILGTGILLVVAERRISSGAGGVRLRAAHSTPLDVGGAPTLLGGLAAGLAVGPLVPLASSAASALHLLPSWLGSSPLNSMCVAIGAALVSGFAAIILGPGLARRRWAASAVDGLFVAGFLLPSMVLGSGLIAAWNHPGTSAIYGTLGIVIVALAARYSALVIRTFAASVAQTASSYDDAARVAGASYLRRLGWIVLPMHARGLCSALGLGLVFSLRDVETSVLLYPPGGETLTVRLFTLEANGPAAVVAAIALVQVAMTLCVFGAVYLAQRSLP